MWQSDGSCASISLIRAIAMVSPWNSVTTIVTYDVLGTFSPVFGNVGLTVAILQKVWNCDSDDQMMIVLDKQTCTVS